jgi:hypothetical protein
MAWGNVSIPVTEKFWKKLCFEEKEDCEQT